MVFSFFTIIYDSHILTYIFLNDCNKYIHICNDFIQFDFELHAISLVTCSVLFTTVYG